MGNQNMYSGMGGEGFVYPGTNTFQPGMGMPYVYYYNPLNQSGNEANPQNVQQQPLLSSYSQNGGMPFIPYPIPYYFNPMMYQQQVEPTKEDTSSKTRKNNYYSTPTGYPGMNANQVVNFYLLNNILNIYLGFNQSTRSTTRNSIYYALYL